MIRRFLPLALLVLSGCGYHVSGTADVLPKTIKTIAVPPFSNTSTKYILTDRLPNMIAREFISRTRYQIVHDPTQADAVLKGTVNQIYSFPTTFDPSTNRAAGVEVQVVLSLQLHERVTGHILYNQPSYSFRQRYEIASTAGAYFDESTTAFQRLSQDVARAVVSGILENF